AIPLLFGKLWSVYPRLFQTPIVRNFAHALERISLVPLVAGALFMLASGVANIDLWYPWSFFFPAAHFWAAWITMGALIVHIGAKLTVTRQALRARPRPLEATADVATTDRRHFLAWVGAASAALPVAGVEGGSATRQWTGVPLRDLVAMAGGSGDRSATVLSAEARSRYRTSPVNHDQLADSDTLLALLVDGEPLAPDHGFPV